MRAVLRFSLGPLWAFRTGLGAGPAFGRGEAEGGDEADGALATFGAAFAEAFFLAGASDALAFAALAGADVVEGEDLLLDEALPRVFAMWVNDRSSRAGLGGIEVPLRGIFLS